MKGAAVRSFPFFPPQMRISAIDRCIWYFGRRKMRAGQGHGYRSTGQGGSLQFEDYPTGVRVTCSDTIRADSRVAFIPIWKERRQTEHAALWSSAIPCFRSPHSTKHFPFWVQPVAAVNEERLRQLKSDQARPEKAWGELAVCSRDSSRLNGLSTGTPQTQDAASVANSEVSKCR